MARRDGLSMVLSVDLYTRHRRIHRIVSDVHGELSAPPAEDIQCRVYRTVRNGFAAGFALNHRLAFQMGLPLAPPLQVATIVQ